MRFQVSKSAHYFCNLSVSNPGGRVNVYIMWVSVRVRVNHFDVNDMLQTRPPRFDGLHHRHPIILYI